MINRSKFHNSRKASAHIAPILSATKENDAVTPRGSNAPVQQIQGSLFNRGKGLYLTKGSLSAFIAPQRRNLPLPQPRRFVPASVDTAFPFFIVERQDISSVGGPFPEREITTDALDRIAIVLTGSGQEEFYIAVADNSSQRFRFFDNQGDLLQEYTTGEDVSLINYRGGGFFDRLIFNSFFFVITSDNTISLPNGVERTRTGDYRMSEQGNQTQVGTYSRITINTTDNASPGTDFSDILRSSYTGRNNFYRVDQNGGVVQTVIPETFTNNFDTVTSERLNYAGNTHTRTEQRDSFTSKERTATLEIYPGLLLNYSELDIRDDQRQITLSRDTGFTQNDVDDRTLSDTVNIEHPYLLLAAATGNGCLYSVRRVTDSTILSDRTDTGGTVEAASFTYYPDMRSSVVLSTNDSIKSFSSFTIEGADGGWFNGGIGPLSPQRIEDVLSCPAGAFTLQRGTFDTLNIDFDSPGAYGDNSSRYFDADVSDGSTANIFCGATVEIVPKIYTGGFVAGQQVTVPDRHPDDTAIVYYPSMNMAIVRNSSSTVIDQARYDLFLYHDGTSHPIANPDQNASRVYLDTVNLALEYPTLLTQGAGYRGTLTIPDSGVVHHNFTSPRTTQIVSTIYSEQRWTNPQSSNPTTDIDNTTAEYTTEINSASDLVGEEVLITIPQTSGSWLRFQGTITAIATDFTASPLTGNTQTFVGAGPPGFTSLKGATINITDGVALRLPFDEYLDRIGITDRPVAYVNRVQGITNAIDSSVMARSQLILHDTPIEDEVGVWTVAGQVYNDAARNLAEIYRLKLENGNVVIRKDIRQQRAFTTTPLDTALADGASYSETALAQWGR